MLVLPVQAIVSHVLEHLLVPHAKLAILHILERVLFVLHPAHNVLPLDVLHAAVDTDINLVPVLLVLLDVLPALILKHVMYVKLQAISQVTIQ